MKQRDLYDSILGMLTLIKDNEEKLSKVLTVLEDQILDEHKEDNSTEVPEKYRDVVNQIADAIDIGFVCFLNLDTLEIEQVQRKTVFDIDDYSEQHEDRMDDFALNHYKWDDYIEFEPLEYNDMVRIMENFYNQLNDGKIAPQLEKALGGEKPISKFNKIINESGEREIWDRFRKKETVNTVRNILLNELRVKEEVVNS